MDGYGHLRALIESAWEELDAAPAGSGDLSLDAIGDVLETGHLTQHDVERTVERLVTVALSDGGPRVRESALHAICTASVHHELPYRVVEPLAVGADAFERVLLEYVLGILGSTHDRASLPVVERYLRHPHPEVRREAADAVYELRWSLESRESAQGGTTRRLRPSTPAE
ncbi:HEAT repeat domain-containing protein [Streptomyces sp. NPDC059072]|uniref:HEAT repeat domain-containing protein n=1 Tax=unclassified Streptomyces TaxID=2593676 RepID=UPI0036A7A25A